MQTFKALFVGVCGFSILLFSSCKNNSSERQQADSTEVPSSTTPPLFTLLSSSQTGIDFTNRLQEGLNTNILMYEYFYNGGGVAAGDLNGDGLTDLYFTANMGNNRLYLN